MQFFRKIYNIYCCMTPFYIGTNQTLVAQKSLPLVTYPFWFVLAPIYVPCVTQDFSKSITIYYILYYASIVSVIGVSYPTLISFIFIFIMIIFFIVWSVLESTHPRTNIFNMVKLCVVIKSAWAYEPTGWTRAELAWVAEKQSWGGTIQNVCLDRVLLYI